MKSQKNSISTLAILAIVVTTSFLGIDAAQAQSWRSGQCPE